MIVFGLAGLSGLAGALTVVATTRDLAVASLALAVTGVSLWLIDLTRHR